MKNIVFILIFCFSLDVVNANYEFPISQYATNYNYCWMTIINLLDTIIQYDTLGKTKHIKPGGIVHERWCKDDFDHGNSYFIIEGATKKHTLTMLQYTSGRESRDVYFRFYSNDWELEPGHIITQDRTGKTLRTFESLDYCIGYNRINYRNPGSIVVMWRAMYDAKVSSIIWDSQMVVMFSKYYEGIIDDIDRNTLKSKKEALHCFHPHS